MTKGQVWPQVSTLWQPLGFVTRNGELNNVYSGSEIVSVTEYLTNIASRIRLVKICLSIHSADYEDEGRHFVV
jgi:hypothetical protein